jgi:formylglycine-generating enzyme required for sulfatase activity
VRERQLVADNEKTAQAKVIEQQRNAEIEGLKQSIRTYALANQVEQARKALARLNNKLSADDPFFTKEAPQVIGNAYLRLAEKKAGAKDNQEALVSALDLIKTGLTVNSTSTDLLKAKENYNEFIAALEQKQQQKQQRQKQQQQGQQQHTQEQQALEQQQRQEQQQALAQQQQDSSQQQTVAQQPYPQTQSPGGKPCSLNLAGLGQNNRAVCYDMLTEQNKGPYMVVIPAGGAVSKPFAIGKYEVSFKDYDLFCKDTGKNSPRISEEPEMPVIRVSYHDTEAYAQWLTEKTGFVYRIPRDEEWVYASESGGKKPVIDYNCLLQQGSFVLKGNSLLSVKSGGANAWGLFNFIGNAQEYVDSSSGIMVRGGAFKNSMSVCSISFVKNHSGSPDELTGFRLVREIKE